MWAKHKQQSGFTIVELLIVIVVIGILAAITIVAYNGVQKRAQGSAASSALSQSAKKLALYQVDSGIYPATLSDAGVSANGNVSYQYAQTNAGTGYCITATSGNVSYKITESTQPTAGACPGDGQDGFVATSCLSVLNAGYSTGSGTYRIKPSGATSDFMVYCDMTTSGGGWTLIVNNPGPSSSWNMTNVYSLNPTNPSITSLYSILNQADYIKTNLNGKLLYRIDAGSLGRWGGVWEAPFTNTFVGTTPIGNVTNIEKYDTWTIDATAGSTNSLSNTMPWIGNNTQTLTTWEGAGNWYGTLVTTSGWGPAPYISPENVSPGIIRYWVK